jgi:hypothetical protein
MRYKGRKSEQTLIRDFPHCVEIEVPLGGFGRTLDLMHAHLHSIACVRGRGRRKESNVTRWRFARREDAETFANTFGGVMPGFEIIWSRRRLEWRHRPDDAPWMIDIVLLERVLLAGRPQQRIVCRLGSISESFIDDAAAQGQFWQAVRRRLGRMRRLSLADIADLERQVAARVPRPAASSIPTVQPGANPVRGPHQPLRQVGLRSR